MSLGHRFRGEQIALLRHTLLRQKVPSTLADNLLSGNGAPAFWRDVQRATAACADWQESAREWRPRCPRVKSGEADASTVATSGHRPRPAMLPSQQGELW